MLTIRRLSLLFKKRETKIYTWLKVTAYNEEKDILENILKGTFKILCKNNPEDLVLIKYLFLSFSRNQIIFNTVPFSIFTPFEIKTNTSVSRRQIGPGNFCLTLHHKTTTTTKKCTFKHPLEFLSQKDMLELKGVLKSTSDDGVENLSSYYLDGKPMYL